MSESRSSTVEDGVVGRLDNLPAEHLGKFQVDGYYAFRCWECEY